VSTAAQSYPGESMHPIKMQVIRWMPLVFQFSFRLARGIVKYFVSTSIATDINNIVNYTLKPIAECKYISSLML
jgi:hypothetical protein